MVNNQQKFQLPVYFFRYTKSSLGSKFDIKPQIAVSGTKHTITTDKDKVIHRKLIFNRILFQNTATPTKRINTRLSTVLTTGTTTCGYRRKEPLRPENSENSADWLKRKEQPMNERGQFISPDKSASKPVELDLSMVSYDNDFQCYYTS